MLGECDVSRESDLLKIYKMVDFNDKGVLNEVFL